MKLQITLALSVAALPFAIAYAERPHQPPQAAFDACAKSKKGDACSVSFGDHTIGGKCDVFPDTTALVCRPDHPPGPPPEAVDACTNKQAGDACSITHGDRTLNGSCEKGPDGAGPLACHPPHPPR